MTSPADQIARLSAELDKQRKKNASITRLRNRMSKAESKSAALTAEIERLAAWGSAMRDAAESMYDAMRDATGERITEDDTDIVRAHARGLAALTAEAKAWEARAEEEVIREALITYPQLDMGRSQSALSSLAALTAEVERLRAENERLTHLLLQDTIPPSYLELGAEVERYRELLESLETRVHICRDDRGYKADECPGCDIRSALTPPQEDE